MTMATGRIKQTVFRAMAALASGFAVYLCCKNA